MASAATSSVMADLLKKAPPPFRARPGELIEGKVVYVGKNKILMDLEGTATGIISGRELRDSFNTFRHLSVGDQVSALVLEEENEEGLIVLSLRMASQQKAWERIHKLTEDDGTMEFTVQEANRGGLLANIDGIRTFLPVSQLAPIHYPRVNNADAAEIIKKLQKFMGHTFTVKVIAVDEEAGKIVVSEREAMSEQRSKALENLKVGDMKEGIVSGIVKFGLFITFDGLEGLVHISEIAWGHVKNPVEHADIGDRVKVKVIGLDGEKLSLSMKQLTKDPWEEVAERYPLGKRVHGTVIRFTDYGAFVKLEKDINGLVHLSEISHSKVTDPSEVLTIGQRVEAQVINVDVDERRIGLSMKALKPIDKETLERIRQEKESKESKDAKESKEEMKAMEGKEVMNAQEGTVGKESKEGEAEELKTKNYKLKTGAGVIEEVKFVASKTGKKYYPITSSAAKKIKEENRVYFKTSEEAEAADYSP